MPHQSLRSVNLLEEIEKLYVVVGKTGSRFFGGGPHRGTRQKRSKILRFSFNKLDPMWSDTFYKQKSGYISKISTLSNIGCGVMLFVITV
jgi:hypothetical protein